MRNTKLRWHVGVCCLLLAASVSTAATEAPVNKKYISRRAYYLSKAKQGKNGAIAGKGKAAKEGQGKTSVASGAALGANISLFDSLQKDNLALALRCDSIIGVLGSLQRIIAQRDSLQASPLAADTVIASLQRSVASLDKRQSGNETAIKESKMIKLSGYLQFRYEFNDLGPVTDGAAATTTLGTLATSVNGGKGRSVFYLQHGRLNINAKPFDATECVLQFFVSKATIGYKDAYLKIAEPWSGLGLALTAGQMTWPFGIELERSSLVRELPENSRVTGALFPGDRDRGLKFSAGPMAGLTVDLGIYNGISTNNKYFSWDDPTRQKDFTARAKYCIKPLALFVSYYDGQCYLPAETIIKNSSGHLVTTSITERYYYKGRIGAGVEAHYALLKTGETVLLAEAVSGRELNNNVLGGYLMLVQSLGARVNIAARIDTYDRDNLDLYMQDWTTGFGVNYQWNKAVRITLAYDVNRTNYDARMRHADQRLANPDPSDDRAIIQFQAKF